MKLNENFKKHALNEIARMMCEAPFNCTGGQAEFCRIYGMNPSIASRIKKGERGDLLADDKILELVSKLGIRREKKAWRIARTQVFVEMEEALMTCKENAAGKILVDKCGIGKTFCAKYFSETMDNCFYVDMSQCKTPMLFARRLAIALKVPGNGQLNAIKSRIKDRLLALDRPVIIIDEAGDVNIRLVAEIKEYYNAVDGFCGWYLMGANGLRNKLERGITGGAVGYEELFSRMSDRFQTISPGGAGDAHFFKTLATMVIKANLPEELKPRLNQLIGKCFKKDTDEQISGLRRVETLMQQELMSL